MALEKKISVITKFGMENQGLWLMNASLYFVLLCEKNMIVMVSDFLSPLPK